jgi:hypothetical protein
MTKILGVVLLSLAAQPALAQDSPIGDETPAAEQATDKAVSEPAAAAADAKKGEPFVPPPGFQTKKRGELVLYCKRDRETGTRFTTEKCYDEEQVREYLLALEIQKRDIDRIRSTCANAAVCAPQ